jgi:hypothetical protein
MDRRRIIGAREPTEQRVTHWILLLDDGTEVDAPTSFLAMLVERSTPAPEPDPAVLADGEPITMIDIVAEPRPRARMRCSACDGDDHNRATCQKLGRKPSPAALAYRERKALAGRG